MPDRDVKALIYWIWHGRLTDYDDTMKPMRDPINEGQQTYWAQIFVEALKHLSSARNVRREDPESHDDPPDALYRVVNRDGVRLEWAELTGVYPSQDAARIVFQEARSRADRSVSSLEELKSVPGMNDLNVAAEARRSVLEKIAKSSYRDLIEKWGLGHLVLFVPYQSYPFMSRWTATEILNNLPQSALRENRYFRSVSLLYANPDFESESIVEYRPNSTAGYAFVPLWKSAK